MGKSQDQVAAERMTAVRPVWSGLALAREALDLTDRTLLHAGPPFPDQHDLPMPVLNSAVHAAMFEGWAEDAASARALIARGEITLLPAQGRRACAPLAAIISPSMWLQVVEDEAAPSRRAYSPINTGTAPPLPHGGADDPAAIERLRFVADEIAPALDDALSDPIALLPVIDASLRGGDDCHGMTGIGSGLICERLADGRNGADKRLLAFLDEAPGYFLFLMMAAAKVMMMAAEGVEDAAIVTTAGGNGRQFGVCLASRPDHWITADCLPPAGTVPDHARALGAIGDSAVIDALGFGGLALGCAPTLLEMLTDHAPKDATALPGLLLKTAHPALLDGRCRFALNARQVVETGRAPLNVLGILDAEGKAGIIGRGLFGAPVALFANAL
ncbi:MAG: DUF1116 domain-containing protein [Pseudomonadota bacterium]